MNLEYFTEIISRPKREVILWLQRRSLIADPLFCGDCNKNMTMIHRNLTHIDGYVWKCSYCKKKRSIRCNSIFALIPRVSLGDGIMMIFFWCKENSRTQTASTLGLSLNVVSKFFAHLDDVCSTMIRRYAQFLPFGGPDCVVQCDESKFNHKRKYNRGRRTQELWVFGIITTEYQPARGYYEVVERRDRHTLLPILRKCLKPNSVLHTDDWGAYDEIERYLPGQVARHRVVNHSLNFVDPVTGVNTQAIESKWNQLKLKQKERKGISREKMQTYLNEKMWREWNGSGDELLNNFFAAITLCYANEPVY